ncbi:hypothetical protein [Nostoc flagelliforme]|uniref:hypothetical protein n=1 Tax=Nostoc flagelliforme TaxID=1306274 RepID=UPI00168465D5|nr:hypothetical protein [Nostoc flagelliforme]
MPRHGLGDCAILSLSNHEERIFNQAAVALLKHFSDSSMGAEKPLSQLRAPGYVHSAGGRRSIAVSNASFTCLFDTLVACEDSSAKIVFKLI